MKRNAIPKRAVSIIVALALVVTCLVTSYAGTIVAYHGDEGANASKFALSLNGGKVEYEIGDEVGTATSKYTASPAIGTVATLTAVDTSSRTFLYWRDELSNRVYSYERTIRFIVTSKMELKPIFASTNAAKHYLTYVNYGGTVMSGGSSDVGAAVTEPTDTKMPGFTFVGWSKDKSAVAADPSDQTIFPLYTVNDESYTVTLTNDEYVSGAGTYSNFQTVNLKAEEKNGEGQSFSYWKDEKGNVVSYERNYSFRINYDTTLTAVYGAAVTPEPVIRITKICRDMSDMKITFYAERSVPEGYTLLSHGILMASGKAVGDATMIVNNATSATSTVRKVYGTSNEPCGTFSLAKTNVGYVEQVTVRPFMIVQNTDGSQSVVYGDILRTTNSSTD